MYILYRDGQEAFDYSSGRTTKDLVDFIKR